MQPLACGSRFKEVRQSQEAKDSPVVAAAPAPAPGSKGPSSPSLPPLAVGQRIDARWAGRSRWFPGVVKALNENGTLAIDYDDGDKELAVLRKFVRPSKSPLSEETGVSTPSADAQQPTKPAAAGRPTKPASAKRPSSSGPAASAAASSASSRKARKAPQGTAERLEAVASAASGEGQGIERFLERLDEVSDAGPPSRSAMQSISIEVRSLRAEQVRRTGHSTFLSS